MSPQQVLARLTDRYALLTQGSRRAPSRQQTLRLSIDWSYELCTPVEQRVWARVAVFSGIFELDAAEVVCGRGLDAVELLDTMASLVDKSILIREESGTAVRFRLLDTVRDYGREKLHDTAVLQELCRRHRDWYQKFVLTGEADWISSRQLEWVNRLEREQPNLREALEFCVSDSPDTGLRIAAALFPFWSASGLLSEGRRWLARLLAGTTGGPSVDRAKALYAASVLAEVQGDLQAGAALVDEGLALAEQSTDAMIEALAAYSDGILAIFGGELGRACSRLEDALDTFRARENLPLQTGATNMLGLANTLRGETERALECYRQVLALSQARGEVVYRSYALWVMGVTEWRQGDADRAGGLLERSLRLTREASNRRTAASGLEALAWIAAGEKKPRRAAVLLGSAEELSRSVGSDAVVFPGLLVHHEECERTSRRALGERGFAEASREGRRLGFDAAVAYALGERAPGAPPAPTAMLPKLTKREGQVADLVAEGLTNKEIAARLVISPRTAQGHVEHVLAKLGFTSRAQIAAWVVEQNRPTH